jgi:transcriptional regulator GlxA family with amidase domain
VSNYTIRATRGDRAIAEGRGIAAARLQAIMADISSNLGDGDLGVAEIARRQRVTPRYIHKLFESEGVGTASEVGVRPERRLWTEWMSGCEHHRGVSPGLFGD